MGYTVPNDLPRKGNERMVIPMKKMLAMLLAVLTLCFGAAAMAESVPEVDDAAEQAALTDLTANGQLIEGDGFQFYIPADWEAAELTDEKRSGAFPSFTKINPRFHIAEFRFPRNSVFSVI